MILVRNRRDVEVAGVPAFGIATICEQQLSLHAHALAPVWRKYRYANEAKRRIRASRDPYELVAACYDSRATVRKVARRRCDTLGIPRSIPGV